MAHNHQTKALLVHFLPEEREDMRALIAELMEAVKSRVYETQVIRTMVSLVLDDPKLRGKLYRRLLAEIKSGRRE